MVASLAGSEFDFLVLTRDRDLTDAVPYSGVPIDVWTSVGKAKVFYTADHSLRNLRRLLVEVAPDVIYFNSFFSPFTIKVLLLRLLGGIPPAALVAAPRGELSPAALGIKAAKKKLFLKFAALVGLYRNLLWHASTTREKQEIEAALSQFRLDRSAKRIEGIKIHVASDFPGICGSDTIAGRLLEKQPGQVSLVFVSRISAIKNLATAIDLLCSVRGDIRFDIYGPMGDPGYWEECRAAIARAPDYISIRYLGAVPHEEAQNKFSEYHFFLFPTMSENFGHVIVESLSAGCPVIISDQTPWLDLERKRIGWDLPLRDRQRWQQILQYCVDMDAEAYRELSRRSVEFVREWISSSTIRDDNICLFRRAVAERAQAGG
jgi:glycosyltransferase involved in cell wall biosynthesis